WLRRGTRPQEDAKAPPPALPSHRPLPPAWKPKANPLVREPAAPVDFRETVGRPLRVRWEGHQQVLSSLALVNRELCLGLLAAGDVELSLHEPENPWRTLSEQDD